MKKLSKEQYEILYFISRGRNSIERLEGMFSRDKILKIIRSLEKLGLILISYRDERIYGFMETPKGEEVLMEKMYEQWYNECGD